MGQNLICNFSGWIITVYIVLMVLDLIYGWGPRPPASSMEDRLDLHAHCANQKCNTSLVIWAIEPNLSDIPTAITYRRRYLII